MKAFPLSRPRKKKKPQKTVVFAFKHEPDAHSEQLIIPAGKINLLASVIAGESLLMKSELRSSGASAAAFASIRRPNGKA